MKKIYLSSLLLSIFQLPKVALAQEIEASASNATIWGILALLFIGSGIPCAISYGIRYVTNSNLKAYVGTYVTVVCLYVLAETMFPALPGSSLLVMATNLLPLSMFGSFLAQWLYYLALVRAEKKSVQVSED